MNFDSVGVSYCYLTGSIHHAHEDHKKEFTKNTKDLPHTAGQPSRLSMFLVSRVQDNGTVIVSALLLQFAGLVLFRECLWS